MRCCEAWDPVGKCFDPASFECIDFHGLSQIIASLTRENLAETDFAAAYPSVNHSWIFHVLEKAELPEFICLFLRRIYYDGTTRVEFAGMTRGQFLMARGVRQGCPASGFLFAMAFDPIFRWLQDAIIPRNPAGLDFLQPAQCGYADDLAVDRFGTCLPLCGPCSWAQFEPSEKCCWVQYGSWSIDLEGEMEKLEVKGPGCGTEGGSVDPKGEMGYRPPRWMEQERKEKS